MSDSAPLAERLARVCRVDCFFVTLAFLLHTTVDDVAQRIGIPVPSPGTSGVSISQIIDSLNLLGLRLREYNVDSQMVPVGGREVPPRRTGASGAVLENRPIGRGMSHLVGVAYTRPDRSGHVVVCRCVLISPHRTRKHTDLVQPAQKSRDALPTLLRLSGESSRRGRIIGCAGLANLFRLRS